MNSDNPKHLTAVLFADPQGVYSTIPDIDLWDESRDARLYKGPWPVVAHPPCHLRVNLAAVNWQRYGRQRPAWYADGTDAGCFAAALDSVFRWGGVLEHPAFTNAWPAHHLPRPKPGRWLQGESGEWITEVWQSAYGHPCRKRTWLLYKGYFASPPPMRWHRNPGTHQVGWFDRRKPTVSKRQANATPIEFARALVSLAEHSRR